MNLSFDGRGAAVADLPNLAFFVDSSAGHAPKKKTVTHVRNAHANTAPETSVLVLLVKQPLGCIHVPGSCYFHVDHNNEISELRGEKGVVCLGLCFCGLQSKDIRANCGRVSSEGFGSPVSMLLATTSDLSWGGFSSDIGTRPI